MRDAFLSDYKGSIDYLYGLQNHAIKLGLNRTENLLARLGDPHRRFKCIHIAGTNGKGSTAAMLSSMLKEHGVRVGLYTSPHLVRFSERFRVNDREAESERVLAVFERIRECLDEGEPPTFFEMVTAMAMQYFAEEKVELAIVETGMGGRLDATNLVNPSVCVITNVSFDHQEYLGNTLGAIAHEKAGIIKDGVPLVTGARQALVQGILKATCLRRNSVLYRFGTDFKARRKADGTFQYHGLRRNWPSLGVGLPGEHQVGNAALALASLEALEKQDLLTISPDAVERGLAGVRWPARLEVLQEHPLILLDGAHNPQGADSLRDALENCFSYKHLHLVMGVMADKDIKGIFRRLLPLAETAIFTKPRYSRAADPDDLRRLARPFIKRHYVIPDVAAAIRQARLFAQPDDLICIAGSLYLAGEVKELLGEPLI